jgi:glycerol-3-phosphate dehydrogenase (NAD(P)+)
MAKIGVFGAGAFGTALAICYSDDHDVLLLSIFDEQVASISKRRESDFLPGFSIPDSVKIDLILNIPQYELDYLLWCVPTKPSVELLSNVSHLVNGIDIVICSKGFTHDGQFLNDAFAKSLPKSKIAFLSGPNFATEIAMRAQSAANIAIDNQADSNEFSSHLSVKHFKLVPICDMIGAQICGAAKNVIAIACGISAGLGLGLNAHAALMSISMMEIANLGFKIGARQETFFGLCGIGDVVLTASSCGSRNTILGKKIADGEDAASVVRSSAAVCEGYDSTRHIVNLAKAHGVELPVCEAVYNILFEGGKPSLVSDILHNLR